MNDNDPVAPLEVLCDAHLARDPIGPLITLVEGRWAYCASHAQEGHHWRRVAPLDRSLLEALPDEVRLICDNGPHLERGRQIPDGEGVLTIADGMWAYCSASLPDEPHRWRSVPPIDLLAIRHSELADSLGGRA